MRGSWWQSTRVLGMLALVLMGCARPAETTSPTAPTPEPSIAKPKSITVGITSTIQAISLAGSQSPTGGWMALTELHSEGLITADVKSRQPVGRLAERVPSLEDGSIRMLTDGRMRVQYALRKGVTWQDRTPFTASDLVFAYQLGGPKGIPTALNRATSYMESVEAPDDLTFVVTYKAAYYQGAVLGPYVYWPLPKHLLGEAYERFLATGNPEEVLNSSYWNMDYIHLGPFRLTEFDPGAGMTFRAYDGYFLGRPRVDIVRVRIFGHENDLFANLLAGAVDLATDNTLRDESGAQLKRMWEASGEGNVYAQEGSLRVLVAQHRPDVQWEASLLQPRGRAALLHALDRDAIGEVTSSGNPQFAAWSILSRSDPNYGVTRDGLRMYSYSTDQTRAILREQGWVAGADGALRNEADGRPFRTAVWTSTGNEQLAALYASYWRAIGLQVDEHVWSAAETRSAETRARFPGWDTTAGGVLGTLEEAPAGPANNWTGNRGGYDDPRSAPLVRAFKSAVAPAAQSEAMKRVNEFFLAELPVLPTHFNVAYLASRRGVRALTPDDLAGAVSDSPANYAYGGYSRNAYLWDVD
jgi:peptide/nickel transport system substrate-binding protein